MSKTCWQIISVEETDNLSSNMSFSAFFVGEDALGC